MLASSPALRTMTRPQPLHQSTHLPTAPAPKDIAPIYYTPDTMSVLWLPLTEEQTASLRILVITRWLMLGAAFGVAYIAAGTTGLELIGLSVILAIGAALNFYMHWLMRRGGRVLLGLPLAASLYDVAGLTAAIGLVDGFDNPNYLFYFPAFLGFTLVFPGWRSFLYCLVVLGIYVGLSVTVHDAFAWSEKGDVKDLALRIVTLSGALLVANLVVDVDRERRDRAVIAERSASAERERVSEEIHDGVSQNVYMLAMSLENLATNADQPVQASQLEPMVQMAKQTLIDTRGLLTNLQPVLTGHRGLASLLEAQCSEFSAVTGLPTTFDASGAPRPIPPEAVAQIYRVTQEALANVYRHANATQADVRLAFEADAITVRVEDDGSGVSGAHADGHGLENMRRRAARIGGELVVHERLGGGTQLELTIPRAVPS